MKNIALISSEDYQRLNATAKDNYFYDNKMSQGRCHCCNIRYIWKGQPKLKSANCPNCGQRLKATTHLFKGKTLIKKPASY